MKKTLRLLAVLSTATVLSSAAYAGGPGGQGDPAGGPGGQGGGPRAACRDDVKTFCSDVQPGGGRIINCLEDHYKEISDKCYTVLQNMPKHGGKGAPGSDAPPPPPPQGGNGDGPPPPQGGNDGPPPPDSTN